MSHTVDQPDLPTLLRLHTSDDGCLRSPVNERNLNNRIFGGQLLGQLIDAAAGTVESDRAPIMLQMTFLHGAKADLPVDYQVSRLQDGRRFSSRHVQAHQAGKPVANGLLSFQVPAAGPGRQLDAADQPAVPPDEAVDSLHLDAASQLMQRAGYGRLMPHPMIDFHFVGPADPVAMPGEFRYWMKVSRPMPDDDRLHAAALAYLSDWWLNFVSLAPYLPELGRQSIYMASLNHAIWFHAPCRADRWLYWVARSIHVGNARTLSSAEAYDADGRHVASVTQQALQTPRA